MSEPTSEPDVDEYVTSRLRAGAAKRDVVELLVDQGVDRNAAWLHVRRVNETLPHDVERGLLDFVDSGYSGYTYKAPGRSDWASRLLVGLLSIMAGLGITACTYASAGPGEAYFVVWVPIALGAYHVGGALMTLVFRR